MVSDEARVITDNACNLLTDSKEELSPNYCGSSTSGLAYRHHFDVL